MISTADLLATFDLSCALCRGPGPDTFADPERLERFLAAAVPAFRTILGPDVAAAGRPVHRACQRGSRPRRGQRAGYDLLRSVL